MRIHVYERSWIISFMEPEFRGDKNIRTLLGIITNSTILDPIPSVYLGTPVYPAPTPIRGRVEEA